VGRRRILSKASTHRRAGTSLYREPGHHREYSAKSTVWGSLQSLTTFLKRCAASSISLTTSPCGPDRNRRRVRGKEIIRPFLRATQTPRQKERPPVNGLRRMEDWRHHSASRARGPSHGSIRMAAAGDRNPSRHRRRLRTLSSRCSRVPRCTLRVVYLPNVRVRAIPATITSPTAPSASEHRNGLRR